jgi:hypothetical protein
MFACSRDWRRLPRPLQRAVTRAWRDLVSGRDGALAAHTAAKHAAVSWYRRNPR